mmetsp:Transcript_14911/g.21696  ORF Transcript_14911/g.21696 Transcript_14911/m.21696 type:complete len:288 (+) Transcript_14911:1-864(+)
MEAKFRQYQAFDFANNPNWRAYYDQVHGNPTPQQLERIKKKWYKRHIDPDFDPEYTQPRQSAEHPRQQPRQQPRQPVQPLQLLQVGLFALAVPSALFGKALHMVVAAHFAGILHYHSTPKLTKEYWKAVVLDDNAHALGFALLFLIMPMSIIWVVPVALGAAVYTADILPRTNYLPPSLSGYLRKLDSKKAELLQMRSDSEVWVGFAVTIGALLGVCHFIVPLVFWQYMRSKYTLNRFTQISFAYLRMRGDQVFGGCPWFLQTCWSKLKQFCNFAVTPQQPSSCSIF